ncbi:FecR family protein [Desulfolutivibrio sulfoxidireducens]|uniref:FecR family protein n=1 Tax=Desulfolutivibrio sulfoxidireducens TaxID=2773299 RepID=UPI00159E71BD|nr:FecR family protein [Desulfolutivibrio sulfoxidireducens]QLA15966.1 hypothetical protein GD605_07310 [Desulfolutivibrio sulfoxidireducens]QLA20131.1 hypothetical protein GD604_10585 [Desulfolutivibrio sulfoxidireducens]
MKTRVSAFLCLFLLFAASIAPAREAGPVGHAQLVQGTVTARLPGQDERVIAAADCVFQSDTARTGKSSKAQFQFIDQSVLVMDAESEIELAGYVYAYDNPPDANAMVVRSAVGLMRVVTGKMAAKRPESFKVETPLLDIGVRGTDLGIAASAASGRVSVLSGGPAVVTDREFGATVEVREGMSVAKERGKPMAAPEPTPPAVKSALDRLAPGPADPSSGGGC